MRDAGPLSSIVWANFLASGWFVHCYFLSCYFFSYLPAVSFSLLLLSYCYPDWINGTITYFPNTCILTWPLLLSFLLLFFPTCPLFLFPCYFFPTAILIESTELLLIFLIHVPVFLHGHCYVLSCYFFSYLPTVTFFPVTLFILLPKWTVTFFPVSFFPTCPLLLSFLLLFFLPETVTFCPVSFFPTCPLLLSFLLLFFLLLFFLPETVTFFPVTFFPVTFFPCTG